MSNKYKEMIHKWYRSILSESLRLTIKEQHLDKLYDRLQELIPDLSEQYTAVPVDNQYLERNVRSLHAFQVSLAMEAIEQLHSEAGGQEKDKSLTVVDIGDSSGAHISYLKSILSADSRFSEGINCLSVNLDRVAVEKIKSKGLDALCCRAEELHKQNVSADVFLSFEMLEHLYDPIGFLESIAKETECKRFVISVPYLKRSRVGMHHIRHSLKKNVYPEDMHVFELSPEDWTLIFKHSGWKVVTEQIYYQYPKMHPMRLAKYLWRRCDFEGFYGVILERDQTWSSCYHTSHE